MASPAKDLNISQGRFRVFIFASSTGTSNEGRRNRQGSASFCYWLKIGYLDDCEAIGSGMKNLKTEGAERGYREREAQRTQSQRKDRRGKKTPQVPHAEGRRVGVEKMW
jgi:hypothetical protein